MAEGQRRAQASRQWGSGLRYTVSATNSGAAFQLSTANNADGTMKAPFGGQDAADALSLFREQTQYHVDIRFAVKGKSDRLL